MPLARFSRGTFLGVDLVYYLVYKPTGVVSTAADPEGRPIVTDIVPASQFYVAEEYHQDYYRKNPYRYKLYRLGCGRDQTLEELWGDDSK